MVTYQQLVFYGRQKRRKKKKTPALERCPQKRAICLKVIKMSPKKPNSAKRAVAKLVLTSTRRYTMAYIPGEGHDLSEHGIVLIRGGRVKDLPGIRYKIIRNKFGISAVNRQQARSKYGMRYMRGGRWTLYYNRWR